MRKRKTTWSVPTSDEVLGLQPHVFPALEVVGKETANRRAAVVDPGVRTDAGCDVVLRVRIEVLQESVQAGAVERLMGPAHDRDVPVRHRLPPKPHGFEGIRLAGVELPVDDQSVPERVDLGVLTHGGRRGHQ